MQTCIFAGADQTEDEALKEAHRAYEELQKPIGRIRYKVPTYIKFYSIYQYDRLKFRNLLNNWLETSEGKNRTIETLEQKQKEILEQCYIRDEKGNPKRDCDENNIFRAGVLQRIHELIYEQLGLNPFESKYYELGNLIIHPEEKQAEIKDSWQFSIKDRIKLHLKLLRRLRNQ